PSSSARRSSSPATWGASSGTPSRNTTCERLGLLPRPDAPFLDEIVALAVEDERGWFVLDQVLELAPELLHAEPGTGRELGELLRVVEVVPAEPDHVPASDRVTGGVDVHHADLGLARLGVQELDERDGDEVAALHRDHGRVPAREQVLGRAVAEVARVLHVEGNRVGAAQLVADVLGRERVLDPELLEARLDLGLEDVADVHLGDADMAVGIALHVLELGEVGG